MKQFAPSRKRYAPRPTQNMQPAHAEGDWISLNGTSGEVILGKHAVAPPELSGDLAKFMTWVDEHRKLKVLTNADTPDDAAAARRNGAEGIGLVRTEHMFFGAGERIQAVRRMIVAQDKASRRKALDDILPFQRGDFEGIFEAMSGLPVTIRLLDPPLHEFLPEGENLDEIVAQMAKDTGADPETLMYTIESMEELNPMLGFRGCRLAIAFPEIAEMQASGAECRLALGTSHPSPRAAFLADLAHLRAASVRRHLPPLPSRCNPLPRRHDAHPPTRV